VAPDGASSATFLRDCLVNNNSPSRTVLLTDLKPADLLCLIASFLNLRDHFRLLAVCRVWCGVCQQSSSFPPLIDYHYGTQRLLSDGLNKLAEYKIRPVVLTFQAAEHVLRRQRTEQRTRRLPDAFVAWLVGGAASRLTRLDLPHVSNALAIVSAFATRPTVSTPLRALSVQGAVYSSKSVAVLGQLEQLTSLNLADNGIGKSRSLCAAVATCLKKLTRLTSLDLSDNDLGQEAGRAVLTTLSELTQLTSLDFAKNDLVDDLNRSHHGALSSLGRLTQLTSLSLAHSNLRHLDDTSAVALASSLAQLTQLTSLNLAGTGLPLEYCGGPRAEALAFTFGQLTRLTSINLANNWLGLSSAGRTVLASVLGQLPQLTSLDITNNPVGDHRGAGALGLADVILRVRLPNLISLREG